MEISRTFTLPPNNVIIISGSLTLFGSLMKNYPQYSFGIKMLTW